MRVRSETDASFCRGLAARRFSTRRVGQRFCWQLPAWLDGSSTKKRTVGAPSTPRDGYSDLEALQKL